MARNRIVVLFENVDVTKKFLEALEELTATSDVIVASNLSPDECAGALIAKASEVLPVNHPLVRNFLLEGGDYPLKFVYWPQEFVLTGNAGNLPAAADPRSKP